MCKSMGTTLTREVNMFMTTQSSLLTTDKPRSPACCHHNRHISTPHPLFQATSPLMAKEPDPNNPSKHVHFSDILSYGNISFKSCGRAFLALEISAAKAVPAMEGKGTSRHTKPPCPDLGPDLG